MGKKKTTKPPPASPHDPLKGNPFGELDAVRQKLQAEEEARAQARPEARRPAPAPPARRPDPDAGRPGQEREAFAMAMSGVRPLAPGATRISARAPGATRPSAASRQRRAQAQGGAGLRVDWQPDRTVRALRPGHEFALEALGRFVQPEETLDLHGLEPGEAARRAVEFVRTRRARGLRCVCIVHGRGRNAPDATSVLLDAVVAGLSQPPGAQDVLAFATADASLGGAGALLVPLGR